MNLRAGWICTLLSTVVFPVTAMADTDKGYLRFWLSPTMSKVLDVIVENRTACQIAGITITSDVTWESASNFKRERAGLNDEKSQQWIFAPEDGFPSDSVFTFNALRKGREDWKDGFRVASAEFENIEIAAEIRGRSKFSSAILSFSYEGAVKLDPEALLETDLRLEGPDAVVVVKECANV